MAERMLVIRRLSASTKAKQQESAVACVDKGMDTFREYCRTPAEIGSDKLGASNHQIGRNGV